MNTPRPRLELPVESGAVEDICWLLERIIPEPSLLLGDFACDAAASQHSAKGIQQMRAWPEKLDIPAQHRYKLAIISDLEELPWKQVQPLLSSLRDCYADSLFLFSANADSDKAMHPQLSTLGFRRRKQYSQPGEPDWLYCFDLYDYKLTPDWFNPKFWAHPERWDQTD